MCHRGHLGGTRRRRREQRDGGRIIKKWRMGAGGGGGWRPLKCTISSQNPPMKILAGRFVSCSQAQRGCALQYGQVCMHTHNIHILLKGFKTNHGLTNIQSQQECTLQECTHFHKTPQECTHFHNGILRNIFMVFLYSLV